MPINWKERIAPAQLRYLEYLVIDLRFTITQRNAHMASIIGRPVKHLDDLTKSEASLVIDKFKEWKERPTLSIERSGTEEEE